MTTTKITKQEEERLALLRYTMQLGLLIESSGRLQSVIGRAMRWGLTSVDAVSSESNRDALLRELDDMKAAIRRVERELDQTLEVLPVAPVVKGHASPIAPTYEQIADQKAMVKRVIDESPEGSFVLPDDDSNGQTH